MVCDYDTCNTSRQTAHAVQWEEDLVCAGVAPLLPAVHGMSLDGQTLRQWKKPQHTHYCQITMTCSSFVPSKYPPSADVDGNWADNANTLKEHKYKANKWQLLIANCTDLLKIQCNDTRAHGHTYAHRRAVVIGTVSGADVNSARQMQGFNSGTTAWFAWAAACLSVIRTGSNSQYSGSWNSLPTRERRHARV